ncbi:hypothetical protein LTR10_023700 [Elasticomyces elasticus]|uniref:Mid2 domain-containing protein n=1 Tax=Exophiala sideris TaxID=1016849 RepID=A0ABR0JR60_9EURO|nr:hypothetical protein LTR10_023700 [Elasticomyces elasticus]KAK5038332.1 hypothetical protein LTS07_001802 [Exophiala sideris]KAK5044316.1 hypothetical protein LTR13_000672 [Exophiala sideris]KAK5067816.1 hypothetical protein LTR69_001805 [Exophiala sideris]KAK5183943.1 hypothetical protein LTR44_003448 [Eurotiomycetes sp. CCFEE 6388]
MSSLSLSSRCALILLAFLRVVSAQVVQDDWLAPALPDFSTTITLGSTFKIQWDSNLVRWFSTYAPEANASNCALWITGSHANSSYQNLIVKNIDVTSKLFVNWVVDIPSSQLSQTTQYTFRFLPLGASYTDNSASQISSPQVIMQLGASSATTSSATTSSTTTPSSTTTSQTSSATSAAATSSSSSTSTPVVSKSSGLSGGAIAGIVVGVVGGLALVGLAAFLLLRRNRRGRTTRHEVPATEPVHSPGRSPAPAYTMSEMDNSYAKHSPYTHPSELDSSPR